MTRTKLTPKRREEYLLRNRARQQTKRIYPFKIKLTLPEQKRLNIKKGGNVIETIQVRRKSKYFTARNARKF